MFSGKEEMWVTVHLGLMEKFRGKGVGIPEMIHQVEREGQKSDTTATYKIN